VRGLSDNYNRDLKNVFQSTAVSASTRPGPLRDFYLALLTKGMRPSMERLTLARKIAAVTLTIALRHPKTSGMGIRSRGIPGFERHETWGTRRCDLEKASKAYFAGDRRTFHGSLRYV